MDNTFKTFNWLDAQEVAPKSTNPQEASAIKVLEKVLLETLGTL